MAVITSGLLQALRTDLRREFRAGYDSMQPQTFWRTVATLVPSNSGINTYGWLNDWPQLQEWVGARVMKDLKESGYQIPNKLFEATIQIPRVQIEDDTIGMYGVRANDAGQNAMRFPDILIADALANGEASLCFDGQNYFDTDHPVYANHDGTGALTTVSNLTDGVETPWYLLDCSRALKPLIFQERTKPEFDTHTSAASSDDVFMYDRYSYGVRYRCGAGYGFWQMAHKAKVELTEDTYDAARLAMRQITADGGRPMGVRPTHILVPPALKAAAKKLFEVPFNAAGATNPWYDDVKVIEVDWL